MNIILYKISDDKINVNKTLNNQKQFSGSLREECSIVNPSFTIQSSENLAMYNYAFIPDFGRYYYVNNPTIVRNNIWRFEGHTDVLMSFKNDFLKLDATIARQQNVWNLYLNDEMYKTDVRRTEQTISFPKSLSRNGSYVLVLAHRTNSEETGGNSNETTLSDEESLLQAEQTATTEGNYDSQYRSGTE